MNMRYAGQVPEGEVYEIILKNRRGFECRVLSLGASLKSLLVPDKTGALRDVALGFDTPEEYLVSPAYLGATVGRFANRIAGAAFEWQGKRYRLEANEGKNQLHGGPAGFSRRLWTPVVLSDQEALFRLMSPDGDMGFPGEVEVEVFYHLEGSALRISYRARTNQATPLSLTNHTYFNLAGHKSGSVGGHSLQLSASRYTPADKELIPDGSIQSTKGTILDFSRPVLLEGILQSEELAATGGLDHNFVLDGGEGPAAVLTEPESGLELEVYTDRPALQVYTAGALGSITGKEGAVYYPHQGICLETQAFPDAVHHPDFPGCILEAGELWESETLFRFNGSGIAGQRRAQMIYAFGRPASGTFIT